MASASAVPAAAAAAAAVDPDPKNPKNALLTITQRVLPGQLFSFAFIPSPPPRRSTLRSTARERRAERIREAEGAERKRTAALGTPKKFRSRDPNQTDARNANSTFASFVSSSFSWVQDPDLLADLLLRSLFFSLTFSIASFSVPA